jgi:predicted TIM-barrel fold metal-dependent hydrolase
MAIDMHAHFLPPELADMLRARQYLPRIERLPDGRELFHRPFGTTPFDPSYVDIEQRVALLESLNIETQLLSLPGLIGIDSLPAAESRPMVRTFNDSLAGLLQRFPGRFAGLAGLPMADVRAADAELRRCVTEHDFAGAILPINCFATVEEARKLMPLFATGDEFGLHFFIHPGRRPDEVEKGLRTAKVQPTWAGTQPLRALTVQTNVAHATVTLLYSDFLDAYPNVTLHVANLGGTYPMIEERIVNLSRVRRPGLPSITESARQIYVDCGSLGPRALRLAVEVFGARHILLGSDTPTFRIEWSLATVRDAQISVGDKALILRENAAGLLKRREPTSAARG